MSSNSHDRSVAMFEAIMNSVTRRSYQRPSELIRDVNMSRSSGYRHIASLEATGFLSRNEAGAYVAGPAARQCGMTASGVGHLATSALPVLNRLCQATRHSCFMGVVEQFSLSIGPFLRGRESLANSLAPRYLMEGLPQFQVGKTSVITLLDFEAPNARRTRALMAPISHGGAAAAVIGIVLPAGSAASQGGNP